MPGGGTEGAADEDLPHVAQHVIAHARMARGVHVRVGRIGGIDGQVGQGVGSQAQEGGEKANFQHDPDDGRRGGFGNIGMGVGRPPIELHHAGGVGDGLHAGQGEHDADKALPILKEPAGQRFDVMRPPWQGAAVQNNAKSSTTTAVGTETKKARPPVLRGPKMLSNPMMAIAPAA